MCRAQEKEVTCSVCSSQPIRSWEGKQVNGFICLTNLVGSRELVGNSCAFFECVVIISKQSAHDLASCPAGPLSTPSFVNCKIEAEITGNRDLKLVAYVAFFMICKLHINNNNKQAWCGLALSKDKSKKRFLEF